MNDSSAHSSAELALRDKTRLLQAITEAMTVFLDQDDWGKASHRLLGGALELTQSEYGFVGVVVEGPVFRVLAHAGIVWDATENRAFYEEALRTYEKLGYLEFTSFDNLFGRVLTSGRPLIANLPRESPYSAGIPPGHPALHHFLGVPFLWGDAVVGMIGVANRPGGYHAAEQSRLESLAQAAGILYDSYRRKQKEASFEAERKRSEEALRESNRRLADALANLKTVQRRIVKQERLRALGLMASGVAHDFNNALQPILGFADYLLTNRDALADPETAVDCLEMIRTAASDAAKVVRRLSEFYRRRGREEVLAPTDLNAVVEHAVRLTQPRWKDEAMAQGVHIRVETEFGVIPIVTAQESELRELLTNLIFNAVDAMPGGGSITLRTFSDSSGVCLEVRDSGVGMSEEVRQRCLEPFFSTKESPRTGMGLAMVYGIVERHRGTIEIESEPGQGTCFRVRFPVAFEGEGAWDRDVEPPAGEDAEAKEEGGLRILLIEDDPLVAKSVASLLIQDGHRVETAETGRQGLERTETTQFDLVLTDQAMPELTGREVAAALKRRRPELPVILVSGFGDMRLPSSAERPEVDLVLSKPVSAASLRRAIAAVRPYAGARSPVRSEAGHQTPVG